MALKIETFSNVKGGQSLFKALGHPLAAKKAKDFLALLAGGEGMAIYDPLDQAACFASLYDISQCEMAAVFVQDVERIGQTVLGYEARPVTRLPDCQIGTVFVTAFDAQRLVEQIRCLLPARVQILTLDALRLPQEMLSNHRNYLDPLNFATNFALFRDTPGHHTRLATANYWAGYGASDSALWLCLFDEDGQILAQWQESLPAGIGSVSIDSQDIRQRFDLGDFTGSLFMHALRIAGHDLVKYALDCYGDEDSTLSCTHDANAWPADLYAGLPAPAAGEKIILWVQNSHPCPIPARAIGLNLMGSADISWYDAEIPAFGTAALDVSALLPEAVWPRQLEVQAGRHFVRPRYEVFSANGRQRIAHANVERVDLQPDPKISTLGIWFGKGYLLPAPILPLARWESLVLPTPMATSQRELPIECIVYDASGREVARHRFGLLVRHDSVVVGIDQILREAGGKLSSGYGHVELVYDFAAGKAADGWLHGLFRYRDRHSGHIAETNFGAHIFNTVLTYKSEPQSYTGRPPGLSTRLFLRLGPTPVDTLCHLIYPASTPWRPQSATQLILYDKEGVEAARRTVEIPCGGSLFWRYQDMFNEAERKRAGEGAYVLIRDLGCRLFGYHGLLHGEQAFSLDHMFGF